jgi:hypothetical protein
MLLRDNYPKCIYVLLVVMIGFSCKDRTPQAEERNFLENCYITKPVTNDSKADTLRNFEFNKDSIDDFLFKVLSSSSGFKYDSTMDYVTSFERQKLIFVHEGCYERLNKPHSCNMMDLYFNSGYKTRVINKSIIEFIQSYKKDIYKFGKGIVYEYRFNGVAEVEPHFMYIILREQTADERRSAKDYVGLVINSDGLEWKDFNDKGLSIPLYVQMIRRSKEFYIPLYYDGERFIPIGHFKSSNWQD